MLLHRSLFFPWERKTKWLTHTYLRQFSQVYARTCDFLTRTTFFIRNCMRSLARFIRVFRLTYARAVLYAGYLCVHPISLPINHFDFFFKRWQTELFAFLFSFDSDRPVLRYWPPNLYVCSASQARNSENSWIQNHNSYIPEAHPGACRAFKNGSTGYRGGPFQSLLWGTVLETWLTCWSKSSS